MVNGYLDHLDSVIQQVHDHPETNPHPVSDAVSVAPPPRTLLDIAARLQREPELISDQADFFTTIYGPPPTRGRWILIDTSEQTLSVMQDTLPLRVFKNIATGRGGLSHFKLRDDETTVKGTFYVNLINPSSLYRQFFRFAYPTHAHVDYAYEKNLISHDKYHSLLAYYRRHHSFPQDTILGGHIGIHGLGEADLETHSRFNWTRGCVALTNQQIDELRKEIELGMIVVVK